MLQSQSCSVASGSSRRHQCKQWNMSRWILRPASESMVSTNASKSSIWRFVITEKAPTRAFSWLKAATTAFTFKTLLRHYAKRALTSRVLLHDYEPSRSSTTGKSEAGCRVNGLNCSLRFGQNQWSNEITPYPGWWRCWCRSPMSPRCQWWLLATIRWPDPRHEWRQQPQTNSGFTSSYHISCMILFSVENFMLRSLPLLLVVLKYIFDDAVSSSQLFCRLCLVCIFTI